MQLPREVCGRCRRPQRVCYCSTLPSLDTRTRIVILQHPRERGMPIGTAHMARLCLPKAELRVGRRWDDLSDLEPAPILLWPGPGARDILREPPPSAQTLVVIDGTWSQAKSVVRDNPSLARLPRYAFAAPEPSHYRIRREPRAEYCSTIEALMHVLGVLEGDPARFRALLDPLRLMVDLQIACQAAGPSRFTPRRPRVARGPELPAQLHGDLVGLVAEANAWAYATRGGTELVHVVAERLRTGERFEALCAPELPLSPSTPHHTELSSGAITSAPPRAELVAGLARFLRPDDVLCTWGHHGANLLHAAGSVLPAECLDLREAAKRKARAKLQGGLEDYAATLGPPPPPRGQGRAGRRLALLAQVVGAWRSF
jgi:DTW domain-containing protein YfiP